MVYFNVLLLAGSPYPLQIWSEKPQDLGGALFDLSNLTQTSEGVKIDIRIVCGIMAP